MQWLTWQDDRIVDGVNSRMRQCLLVGTTLSRSQRLWDWLRSWRRRSNRIATDTALPRDHTHYETSEPLVLMLVPVEPQVLYQSPRTPAVFQLGLGLAVPSKVERWVSDEEGTA